MKRRTATILAACLAMVSCSHAPTPQSKAESSEGILTKIYATDGTLYVTNRYSVNDSTVVIEEVLRNKKFYPDPGAARLYNHPDEVKEPPSDIKTPVVIPTKQISRIEPWSKSHETANRVLIGLSLAVVAAVVMIGAFASGLPAGGD